MNSIFDAHQQYAGSVDHGIGGATVVRDAMGLPQQVFRPFGGNGDGAWYDAMGNVTDRVSHFANQTNHFSAGGAFLGSASRVLGREVFRNPVGMTVATFDPMTSNVTDSIGQLMGRIR